MRLKPLLGATTQASERGRFRSLRKYSNTVGCSRRNRGKVIEGLVNTGDQAGGCHVVAQNSPVDHLGEKSRLRNQFAHQVRNILLAFRRKCLLIAGPAAERDDHHFSLFSGCDRSGHRAWTQQRARPKSVPAAFRRKSRRLQDDAARVLEGRMPRRRPGLVQSKMKSKVSSQIQITSPMARLLPNKQTVEYQPAACRSQPGARRATAGKPETAPGRALSRQRAHRPAPAGSGRPPDPD